MARLSNDEIKVLKANTCCNVTDNDTWENETVIRLIETIEAQQQYITALEKQVDAEGQQKIIETQLATLIKSREALEQIAMYDKYMSGADEVAKATIAEIDKVLGGEQDA